MTPRREDNNEHNVDAPTSESTRLLLPVDGGNSSYDDDASPSPSRSPSSNTRKPKQRPLKRTIAILSFTLLVQSYLLVSVFPYSGFLAMHLLPGVTEETAGSYAGFIASSFMAGRTISSFEWGKAADKYGRVFVIEVSMLLSAFFSIGFGLAPTFATALWLRGCLGLCNGLIGPVKTLVSEYADGDPQQETQMMAIVLGMWGYGFLINPAISGFLSDPIAQYPDAAWVRLLRPLLTEFPFFLPNVVGCLFCLVGYVLVHNFVEETLPEDQRQDFRLRDLIPTRCCGAGWILPLPPPRRSIQAPPSMIRNVSSWGLFKHLHNEEGENSDDLTILVPSLSASASSSKEKTNDTFTPAAAATTTTTTTASSSKATIESLLSREGTRQHMLIYWGYSFLIVTLDEVFPLFCMSKASGLGITEQTIGKVLSGSGLLFIFIQYFLTTRLVDSFGFYKSLRIGTVFSIPLGLFFPVALFFQGNNNDDDDDTTDNNGTISVPSLVFLSALYALIRSFSSVVFSTITMATNRTVPASERASMNGLAMLGGSLAKAGGPLFGGIAFSTSVGHLPPPWGSLAVYSTTTVLGLGLAVRAYRLREYDAAPKP